MQVVKVPLSVKGIAQAKETIEKINNIINSKGLLEYIRDKIEETLNRITVLNLGGDIEENSSHLYRGNNKVELEGNVIKVFNKTIISTSDIIAKLNYKNPDLMNKKIEDISNRYPNGFDLSKAVEYGTGQIGASSDAANYAGDDGWAYMQNPNRDYSKPWSYQDNGEVFFTKGMSGKLIFLQTRNEVEKNITNWVKEYINKELGGIK